MLAGFILDPEVFCVQLENAATVRMKSKNWPKILQLVFESLCISSNYLSWLYSS